MHRRSFFGALAAAIAAPTLLHTKPKEVSPLPFTDEEQEWAEIDRLIAAPQSSTVRIGLPQVTWRRLNEGVLPTKGRRV